jgi:hypothetical protein
MALWRGLTGDRERTYAKDRREHLADEASDTQRVFRRTCCFSKKLFKHWKALDMTFFYIT